MCISEKGRSENFRKKHPSCCEPNEFNAKIHERPANENKKSGQVQKRSAIFEKDQQFF
jgi:hypothetical protein